MLGYVVETQTHNSDSACSSRRFTAARSPARPQETRGAARSPSGARKAPAGPEITLKSPAGAGLPASKHLAAGIGRHSECPLQCPFRAGQIRPRAPARRQKSARVLMLTFCQKEPKRALFRTKGPQARGGEAMALYSAAGCLALWRKPP